MSEQSFRMIKKQIIRVILTGTGAVVAGVLCYQTIGWLIIRQGYFGATSQWVSEQRLPASTPSSKEFENSSMIAHYLQTCDSALGLKTREQRECSFTTPGWHEGKSYPVRTTIRFKSRPENASQFDIKVKSRILTEENSPLPPLSVYHFKQKGIDLTEARLAGLCHQIQGKDCSQGDGSLQVLKQTLNQQSQLHIMTALLEQEKKIKEKIKDTQETRSRQLSQKIKDCDLNKDSTIHHEIPMTDSEKLKCLQKKLNTDTTGLRQELADLKEEVALLREQKQPFQRADYFHDVLKEMIWNVVARQNALGPNWFLMDYMKKMQAPGLFPHQDQFAVQSSMDMAKKYSRFRSFMDGLQENKQEVMMNGLFPQLPGYMSHDTPYKKQDRLMLNKAFDTNFPDYNNPFLPKTPALSPPTGEKSVQDFENFLQKKSNSIYRI